MNTKNILPLLLTTLMIASVGCGDDFGESTNGAILVTLADNTAFSDTGTIAFEAIKVDQKANTIFLIGNTSDEADLEVSTVRLTTPSPFITLSGGLGNAPVCDAGVCTAEAFVLEPLQKAQFDLTYAPTAVDSGCGNPPEGKSADWCGTVEINSGDSTNAIVLIDIHVPRNSGDLQVCQILGTGEDCQAHTVDFRVGDIGEEQKADFRMRNIGTNTLNITQIINELSPSEEFVVDASGQSTPIKVEPGQVIDLTLSYSRKSDSADTRGGVVRIGSDGGGTDTVTLRVTVGNPNAASIDVSPTSLTFPNVDAGNMDTKQITVTHNGAPGSAALTIDLDLQQDGADYALFDDAGNPFEGGVCDTGNGPESCVDQLIIGAGGSKVLDLTYAPVGMGSNATLVIKSNDPENPAVSVFITSASAAVGVLSSSESSLTWNSPAKDTPSEKTIELTNQGTAALDITGVTFENFAPESGADLFEVDLDTTSPVTLDSGASKTVVVTHTRPSDDEIGQNYQGNLVFTHTGAGGSTTVSVQVNHP